MSRKYNKKSSGLLGAVVILVLVVVMIAPVLSSLGTGGFFAPAPGGGVTGSGGEETPGTGGDDTGGGNAGDMPGGNNSGGITPDDEGIVVPDVAFDVAAGRTDENGNCLHSRYVYSSASAANDYKCYYTCSCARCEQMISGKYAYHHFWGATCQRCGTSCEHEDADANGYCDKGCGYNCQHVASTGGSAFVAGAIGNLDENDQNVYFFNLYPGNSVVNLGSPRENAACVCSICDYRCYHSNTTETYTYYNASYCNFLEKCTTCGYVFGNVMVAHKFDANGVCTYCNQSMHCDHLQQEVVYAQMPAGDARVAKMHNKVTRCLACGKVIGSVFVEHAYIGLNLPCSQCGYKCEHDYSEGVCKLCARSCDHEYVYSEYSNIAPFTVVATCNTCKHSKILTNETRTCTIYFDTNYGSACYQFTYRAGMTWRDFIEYAAGQGAMQFGEVMIYNFGPDYYRMVLYPETTIYLNGEFVYPDDFILIDGVYTTFTEGGT